MEKHHYCLNMLANIYIFSLLVIVATCVIQAAVVDPTGKLQMCATNLIVLQ